ncbi:GNAT family N-acetyltransferase [Flavobacterium rhizosphaerae]|uniref:GNAT family N-acetyltransferase n=1 Tax=Flavobacterium rhizosphaerae TaxID=3163298 RepID=A0ABW8YS52_9FLAO
MEDISFTINDEYNQFELDIEGGSAFLEYFQEEDKLFLTHTEVSKELRGKGYAAELVKRTLQYAKDNNLMVVPGCSYVAHYVNEHPEWNSVLSEGYRM